MHTRGNLVMIDLNILSDIYHLSYDKYLPKEKRTRSNRFQFTKDEWIKFKKTLGPENYDRLITVLGNNAYEIDSYLGTFLLHLTCIVVCKDSFFNLNAEDITNGIHVFVQSEGKKDELMMFARLTGYCNDADINMLAKSYDQYVSI